MFFNLLLNRNKASLKKLEVLTDEELMYIKRDSHRCYNELRKLADIEEIYVFSKDNVRLHAYYVKASSNKWVILYHDYLQSAKNTSRLALFYHKKNYNVLMIDSRAHGKSRGSVITMGYREKIDVISFISWIYKKQQNPLLVLHGIGLGASVFLKASPFFRNFSIKSIIADSAYTSVYDLFYYHMYHHIGILTNIVLISASFITKIRAGFTFKEINVLNSTLNNQAPTLFLASKDDILIPPIMTEKLYNSCSSFKEKYIFRGKHSMFMYTQWSDYGKVIEKWIKYIEKL